MPGYVIAMLDVLDPVAYERYKAAALPTIAAAGGRHLARGGERALEGSHDGRRVVILEFPSVEAARAWYQDRAYVEARKLRASCAGNVTFLVLPGVGAQ
ncbi:MAG TPA: DUF1330 domain-containing protein [Kofleriaceae bacterium]|nr:DUF1330 domain-containing protein [Kofleriaceae bacterium]